MAAGAVLPEEDARPGAEAEAASDEGDDLGRAGERHLDVAGHVVGTFVGVCEVRIVFGHEAVDEAFQITARRRIRVFHDNETAAGVAAKDSHGALVEAGFEERFLDHVGELRRRFTRSGDDDLFGKGGHGRYESGRPKRWEG